MCDTNWINELSFFSTQWEETVFLSLSVYLFCHYVCVNCETVKCIEFTAKYRRLRIHIDVHHFPFIYAKRHATRVRTRYSNRIQLLIQFTIIYLFINVSFFSFWLFVDARKRRTQEFEWTSLAEYENIFKQLGAHCTHIHVIIVIITKSIWNEYKGEIKNRRKETNTNPCACAHT